MSPAPSAIRWLTLVAAVIAAPVEAQVNPYTMTELAPGVHAVVRRTLPNGAADANVLVIINQSDVLVVDAGIFPESARQVIGEIRKLTANPVRYVVNTHWHSDHHYGNQAYRDAYPGVEFVQHRRTREDIIARDLPSFQKNLDEDYPAVAERLRTALRTGRTSRGDSVTADMRAGFERSLALYEFFLKDLRDTRLIPGTLVVEDSLVLHRGDRTIVIKYLGRGNTEGDLVVHLPRERVVATGDLVVHPLPFAFFSSIGEWPATLRKLRQLDAARILPGHGDIQHDWSYLDRLIPLIESTWEQVRAAVARGDDLEATRKAVNLDRFRDQFATTEEERARFDYLFVNPAVEAAHAAGSRER